MRLAVDELRSSCRTNNFGESPSTGCRRVGWLVEKGRGRYVQIRGIKSVTEQCHDQTAAKIMGSPEPRWRTQTRRSDHHFRRLFLGAREVIQGLTAGPGCQEALAAP